MQKQPSKRTRVKQSDSQRVEWQRLWDAVNLKGKALHKHKESKSRRRFRMEPPKPYLQV